MKLAEYTKMGIDICSLPLIRLRAIDIDTPDEEKIVSEVMNRKLAGLPPERKIQINDIIHQMNLERAMTPELEDKYQKMIDERMAKERVLIPESISEQEVNLDSVLATPAAEHSTATTSDVIVETPEPVEITSRFCNSCDSKGVRHKKGCEKATLNKK